MASPEANNAAMRQIHGVQLQCGLGRAMRPRAVSSPEEPAALSALGPPGYAQACLGCVWAVWGAFQAPFWAVFSRLQAARSIQLFLGRFILP